VSNVGRLYRDEDTGRLYVLLKTRLGYLALELQTSCGSYGGLHRTEAGAVEFLKPTGYHLDLDKTTVREKEKGHE